jgi:hypothetical protein
VTRAALRAPARAGRGVAVRARRLAALWLAGGLVAGACARRDEPPAAAAAVPPALPRAALVLEPPRLRAGDVATLEIAVSAPPGHVVLPPVLPAPPEGLWVLGSETLPAERESARWLHRTQVRVRARDVGELVWPGSRVEIEAPDGARTSLAIEPLAIEVVSVMPEHPDRLVPFGPREPPDADAPRSGAFAGAAIGAGLTLAGIAAARAIARRRARRAALGAETPAAPSPPTAAPWEEARAAFAHARDEAAADPFAASERAARALRRYADRRFGTHAGACTAQELAAAAPPFAATTRWHLLVAALAGLDAHRFRPQADREARDALGGALPAALAAAERFVEETLPPETPR